MKYKFIVIFLSSSNLSENNVYFGRNQTYDFLKQHIPKYFANYMQEIKYFFLECKKDLVEDICEVNDYIYVKGEESVVPGVIKKLKKCINYINKNYDYEYIIRTNLTTLFNLNRLLDLYSDIPKSLFGGYYIFNSFISGVAIIISKNLTEQTVISADEHSGVNEDVLLTQTARKNNISFYMLNETSYSYKILERKINMYDNCNNSEINNDTLMYRITNQDNAIVLSNFVLLMKKIYCISL